MHRCDDAAHYVHGVVAFSDIDLTRLIAGVFAEQQDGIGTDPLHVLYQQIITQADYVGDAIGMATIVSSYALVSYGATRAALSFVQFGKGIFAAGRAVTWLATGVLPMVGRAILLLGRAMLMTPIGLMIGAIAGAAYLIYKAWEPAADFFDNLWSSITDIFGDGMDSVMNVVDAVMDFDWSSLLTVDGIAAAWRNVSGYIGSVASSLRARVTGIDWASLLTMDTLRSAWPSVTGFMAGALGRIAGLAIEGIATGIEFVARSIETITGVFAGAANGDMNRVSTELREFFDWLTSGLSLPEWMTGFSFGDLFRGVDASGAKDALIGVLTFSWLDVLPDWNWSAIIPPLPDLRGMFGDAGETIDVRLESRANAGFGQWEEGLALVEQYRAGLIVLDAVQAALAAKVATEEGQWNWSKDVERAAEMLELLDQINGVTVAPDAIPDIANPETLLQAARAADELTATLPAITEAANATLTAAQGMIVQIGTAIAAVDLSSQGARIVQSIADGMLAQIGAVQAAADRIAATIRAAMPDTARVQIGLPAAANVPSAPTIPGISPTVQARASGGAFKPGWLLTGERGPELEYRSEGGFIAHNDALSRMVAMSERVRELSSGIRIPDAANMRGMIAAPAMAAVAASGAAAAPVAQSHQANTYHVAVTAERGMDTDDVARMDGAARA